MYTKKSSKQFKLNDAKKLKTTIVEKLSNFYFKEFQALCNVEEHTKFSEIFLKQKEHLICNENILDLSKVILEYIYNLRSAFEISEDAFAKLYWANKILETTSDSMTLLSNKNADTNNLTKQYYKDFLNIKIKAASYLIDFYKYSITSERQHTANRLLIVRTNYENMMAVYARFEVYKEKLISLSDEEKKSTKYRKELIKIMLPILEISIHSDFRRYKSAQELLEKATKHIKKLDLSDKSHMSLLTCLVNLKKKFNNAKKNYPNFKQYTILNKNAHDIKTANELLHYGGEKYETLFLPFIRNLLTLMKLYNTAKKENDYLILNNIKKHTSFMIDNLGDIFAPIAYDIYPQIYQLVLLNKITTQMCNDKKEKNLLAEKMYIKLNEEYKIPTKDKFSKEQKYSSDCESQVYYETLEEPCDSKDQNSDLDVKTPLPDKVPHTKAIDLLKGDNPDYHTAKKLLLISREKAIKQNNYSLVAHCSYNLAEIEYTLSTKCIIHSSKYMSHLNESLKYCTSAIEYVKFLKFNSNILLTWASNLEQKITKLIQKTKKYKEHKDTQRLLAIQRIGKQKWKSNTKELSPEAKKMQELNKLQPQLILYEKNISCFKAKYQLAVNYNNKVSLSWIPDLVKNIHNDIQKNHHILLHGGAATYYTLLKLKKNKSFIISDYDFMTSATILDVQKICQPYVINFNGSYNIADPNQHKNFITFKFICNDKTYVCDFTVKSKETFTNAGLKKQALTRDIYAKALLVDLNKEEIIDPTEQGINDCLKLNIRFINNPTKDPSQLINALKLMSNGFLLPKKEEKYLTPFYLSQVPAYRFKQLNKLSFDRLTIINEKFKKIGFKPPPEFMLFKNKNNKKLSR